MTLYSSKGGVETYYFHYTSHSDIPVEAICWNEGEEDQPIEIPSTTDDTTNTTDYLVDQARELIKNVEGDTPKWLTALGGPGIVVAILSSMLDYAPNIRYVSSAICEKHQSIDFGVLLRQQLMLSSKWTGSLRIFHILQRPRIINSRRNTQIDFFGPITREIIQNYVGPVDLDPVLCDDPSNALALELNTCSHLSDFRISLKATGVSEPSPHIAYLQIHKAQRIRRREKVHRPTHDTSIYMHAWQTYSNEAVRETSLTRYSSVYPIGYGIQKISKES
ncbi:uncharacterized protein ARMOST_21285 [Armillaria ostoyae]|uniref:Uncharacterized protein n=1 Tax=Armillaria ostoyae TaxID=47428 RepID=A0A284S9P1_ARMOS|nr:uncharacterized protein ARMOST_21285 [Armillaria ostoyae]